MYRVSLGSANTVDLGAESLSRILTKEHTETNFRDAAFPGRSHLSPDGGGFTRAAPPLGSGWLRFAFPPILFVRNPPANRPNHRENRYNPEDWQHFL